MNLFAAIFCFGMFWPDDQLTPDFQKHFAGIEGAFLLYDTKPGKYYRHNKKRCAEHLSPCSTFKIPNALIALETGVVTKGNFAIKWDSLKTPRQNLLTSNWARDHNLRSAMRYSVVWYFQEIARRVGEQNYKKYLSNIAYGNQDISGGIDRFWLSSSLKISANEQVEFLRKFFKSL